MTLMLSTNEIIFGGGIIKKTPKLEDYIVTQELGDNSETVSCLALDRDSKLHS
ncbi:hypothetical protein [Enterococcus sp. AZ163]|uniref:hypothetical protein n=1 Tax=Enterococcus sp. AZ163 TaxID=2774638 RepID=UPI003D2DD219